MFPVLPGFCEPRLLCAHCSAALTPPEIPSPAELSSPGNLTLVDIKAPLWHEPHAPLRLFAAEGVEVVNVRGLIRDLEVADAAVTLQGNPGDPPEAAGAVLPVPTLLLPTAFPSRNAALEARLISPTIRVHQMNNSCKFCSKHCGTGIELVLPAGSGPLLTSCGKSATVRQKGYKTA